MMNFQTTDEQKLIQDSAQRWVAAQLRPGAEPSSTPATASKARWQSMAEMGWLGMALPTAYDGLGQGLAEACVLCEALGGGPLAEPFIPAIIQAGEILARGASEEQRQRWLPKIADGSLIVVPAVHDIARSMRSASQPTRARREAQGWVLIGEAVLVPAGTMADAWLIPALDQEGSVKVFYLPRGSPGTVVRELDTVDGAGASLLRFDQLRLGDESCLGHADQALVLQAFERAGVAACAEAVGAMQALLAATVAYTRTRTQFGRPLSDNQVLRHRMADMSIACEEAKAMTMAAIARLTQSAEQAWWHEHSLSASALRAKVAALAQRVAEEAIQMHGGVGVTDELNMGRYLRRLLALDAMYGGADVHLRRHAVLRSRREPSRSAADTGPAATSPVLQAFREEVRTFLREELSTDLVRASRLNTSVFSEADIGLQWQKALHQRGWCAPAWPVEYGGTGWTLAQRWIFETELALAGAPPLSPLGLRMAGPVIMRFGTAEQKAHYLPRILAGDDYWCQGYSEPGSGSDLASLKTRARREHDHYLVNGSKIWTTHAHLANRMFALVRTGEPGGRKQDGISFLLIDMATPGITVRPIRSASGDHEVNQVFFDDVRVPVSCRVGAEGQGWEIAKYLLEFERGGAISSGRLRAALDRVMRLAQGSSPAGSSALDDPDLSRALSALEIDIEALESTELRVMASLQVGQNPGSVSSLLKLRWSEIHQSITRLGVRLLGSDALLWESQRPMHLTPAGGPLDDAARPVLAGYLNARAFTIFGGTSEIQREIIARDVIG